MLKANTYGHVPAEAYAKGAQADRHCPVTDDTFVPGNQESAQSETILLNADPAVADYIRAISTGDLVH